MTRTQIFADWQAGAISDREALRALLSDLGEVESQITPLETERADLRTQISEVLASLGYTDQELAALAAAGAIKLRPPTA